MPKHRSSRRWLFALSSLFSITSIACKSPETAEAPDSVAPAAPPPPSQPSAQAPPTTLSVMPTGDMQLTRAPVCLTADKLDNTMAPPDLFAAMDDCATHGRYPDALVLFALAGVYGRYDTLRVADETSHKQTSVLRMQYFDSLPSQTQKALLDEHDREDADAGAHRTLCDVIAKIGKPSYAPTYMMKHGLGGSTKTQATDDGIVVGFDAAATWRKAMGTYLHCVIK